MAQPGVEQRKEVGATIGIEKLPAGKTIKERNRKGEEIEVSPDQRVNRAVAQPSKKCETSVAARFAETYLPGTGEPLSITICTEDF